MDASFGAISQHLAPRLADCMLCSIFIHLHGSNEASFAFVEYESRRDADDAYHEMHNKRIGRDDLLKIEVRFFDACHCSSRLNSP